jgi:hypothetical protein
MTSYLLGASASGWLGNRRRERRNRRRAVYIISLPNIGLFDKIANPARTKS